MCQIYLFTPLKLLDLVAAACSEDTTSLGFLVHPSGEVTLYQSPQQ